MNTARIVVMTTAFAVILGLSAPLTIAAAQDHGVLEIQIKDHREAIGDFAKFDITIDQISISPKPGLMFWQTGWKDLAPSMRNIDLTQYISKKTARVFRSRVDAGAFDALQIEIKSIKTVLKKTSGRTPVKNTLGALKLAFEVPAQGETVIILDLVVTDFSDHPPRGYELGIKGYEVYTNGKLVDKIPPG
jgi:Domain of unknown function (DUF4382)